MGLSLNDLGFLLVKSMFVEVFHVFYSTYWPLIYTNLKILRFTMFNG